MSKTIRSQAIRAFASMVLLIPLIVASLSQHSFVSFTNGMDAYAHWGAFFIVSTAIFFLEFDRPISTFIFLIVLAICLELGQSFIETRIVDGTDAIANLLGVVGAFITVKVLRAWFLSSLKSLLAIYLNERTIQKD